MLKMLYEKSNYVNPNMAYIVNRELIEYDMEEAGFNLIKQFKLCSVKRIMWLEEMGKERRKIAIGILQRDDRDFNSKFQKAFVEARKLFFEANMLDETNVVSIKRDAIFTTKICHHQKFGYINFRSKNQFSSFFKFDDLEFYYRDDGITVKGLGKKKEKQHEPYMLSILHTIFQCVERNDIARGQSILSEFIKYYRRRELDIGYYREINRASIFRLYDRINNQPIGAEYIEHKDIHHVDISYNYNAYLVPLIALFI